MYQADGTRYEKMEYAYCGHSGLKMPRVALGFWNNFGYPQSYETMRGIVRRAFDLGVTHMDLANNYGPPAGAAEENFGRILKEDLGPYRDELIISSKAGYSMWPGPYGDGGSRKYLMASLDQSLLRMGLDYVDIFYHHRVDRETPLEETMQTLADIVRQGKALYVGISNYRSEDMRRAYAILKEMHVPLLINQVNYSMLDRWVERDGLLDTCAELGVGSIIFSPLQQGLLTDRYLKGIPQGSRADQNRTMRRDSVTPEVVAKVEKLNALAARRGQTMAAMALAWVLRGNKAGTVLCGASSPEQMEANVACLRNRTFTEEELKQIDEILGS
ncbi:MAG: L-glyceraldehyde 3-phosphate reductase [Clostridia bacterium]|nr:L-glyceraldehyde 3-phosphate reductase [Clostridia bacterium]